LWNDAELVTQGVQISRLHTDETMDNTKAARAN
jgi:hypothetical protein